MNKKYDYIIFHKGCIDGFTSFIVLYKSQQINRNAIIYPDIPSATQIPDNIINKNVIIMDVAYKYNILLEIIRLSKHITFIDHHITTFNEIQNINDPKFTLIYNKYECGASLTWKFFFKNKPIPLFIKYIKDNDIGEWKLKDTRNFIAGLSVKYNKDINHKNIIKWLTLLNEYNVKKLINKGIIYNEYIDYIVNANFNKFSVLYFPSKLLYTNFKHFFIKPNQYKVAVYTGRGCPSITLISEKILEKTNVDFVIMWTYNFERQEYILSFRSKTINVGNIAQLFGGGGHDFAASCTISKSLYKIDELFNI